MEQKGKTGSEGLRNGDVVNEDKISELPDDLLLHILSSLPTEMAITTSVLSKRWRSLWALVPNLKFDSEYHNRFSENVCRSLILHKAPVLESLHLRVEDQRDASDVGVLVGIAFAHNLRKLVLTVAFQDESSIRFPSVLCSFNNTLEILKLEGSILLDLPSPGCFKSLRELHLYYVHFKDEKSVCNLLCGCPSLEDLVVHISDNVETFTVAVPSLQRLTIYDSYPEESKGGYVINAPSLKYLNLKGNHRLEFCLIENALELVEAKISNVSYKTNENILETLTHAKRLSLDLSPLQIKYPIGGKIFEQLLYLELRTNRKEWRNLLSLMLDRSPKLKILKLINPYHYYSKESLIGQEWNQPKCVPECLLFHLEIFLWIGYEWQLEDEKEVATYILKNARRLKKATLSTKPIESRKLVELEKRRQRN